MAQIPDSSQEKVSYKSSKKVELRSQNETKEITPEQAASFKGRIPNGIKDQVMAINEQQRQQKKQLLRESKSRAGYLIQQKKIDAFLEEFLKNGGNATDAAMAVFNVTSRASAATIGSYYLKKAKVMGRIYLEQKGYSYGRLLSIAAQKAEMSRLPDWWDRVMEIADYGNFRTVKGGVPVQNNINIVQTEKELFRKYTYQDADIVEEPEEEPEESKNFEVEEKEDDN